MTAAPKTRSILVQTGGGRLIVDNIPANAKVTYGPVSPGKPSGYGEGNALRIYTTAGNQLAVFKNVEYFRDLSLNVREEKVTKTVREDAERGPDGEYRKSDYESTREWVEVEV